MIGDAIVKATVSFQMDHVGQMKEVSQEQQFIRRSPEWEAVRNGFNVSGEIRGIQNLNSDKRLGQSLINMDCERVGGMVGLYPNLPYRPVLGLVLFGKAHSFPPNSRTL
jgi:hypothetical protein